MGTGPSKKKKTPRYGGVSGHGDNNNEQGRANGPPYRQQQHNAPRQQPPRQLPPPQQQQKKQSPRRHTNGQSLNGAAAANGDTIGALANARPTREQIAERYANGSGDRVTQLMEKRRLQKAAAARQSAINGKSDSSTSATPSAESRSALSGAPPSELMDPRVQAHLAKQQKKLEESGFDPYSTSTVGSGNARNVIAMGGFGSDGNSTAEDEISTVSSPPPLSPLNDDDYARELVLAQQVLSDAIEYVSVENLQNAVGHVQRLSLPVRRAVDDEYREVEELLHALKLSHEGTDGSGNDEDDGEGQEQENKYLTNYPTDEAQLHFQQAVERLVNGAGTNETQPTNADRLASLQTLKKLFENVVKNPQEEKFHKIKLSNATVHKRLVEVQDGAGKDALIAAGFVEKFDDALGTSCLVVEPSAVVQMVEKQDILLQFLDSQLANIGQGSIN